MSLILLRKSSFFRTGLLFAFWAVFVMGLGDGGKLYAATQLVPSGKTVVFRVTENISSAKVNPGDQLTVVVAMDVKVNGKIVIKSGTPGIVNVSTVEKKGGIGKPGSITVQAISTTDIEGNKVDLNGSLSREGKNKQTSALLLGIFICFILLFTIKGKDGTITAGSQIRATVI